MSVLALAAVIEGSIEYQIVDGNVERNPYRIICETVRSNPQMDLLAVSVMPGAQLVNAIRDCRKLKGLFPHLRIVWGGYFPTMHTDAVVNTPFIDYVVRGQGEQSFIDLLHVLETGGSLDSVPSLSYRSNQIICSNPAYPIYDPNLRPFFPYESINIEHYAIPTFIGKRTLCHETSVGCPHRCNFCGVVDAFQSRWKAEHVDRTLETVRLLKRFYGMDGIEFHDSEFFVSEKRTAELSRKLIDEKIRWWAEGRIDTLLKYDRETWKLMEQSGLKMLFFGAESGLDETLALMDKSGVDREKTKLVAARCREFGIQPEFSFVMGGNPTRTEEDIDATIDLIYELIEIEPRSQMHPFLYTPVPLGTIFKQAREGGLRYPFDLNEWERREWKQYGLRQKPHTHWLTRPLRRKIINFRAVHQSYRPKLNDRSVPRWRLTLLKAISWWRYKARCFTGAYEVRLLLKLLLNGSNGHEGF